MVAISQVTFWNAFSWMKIFAFFILILLKSVPKGPINSIPALVRIMDWHQPGNKPLAEPLLAYFTDAYMCH